ncbi:MAG: TonB-dependent receptor [Prevotellaceae bacterium]|jgi:iron complex outermembrane receptor protein|nr:TonB-dependent receptor [Prevotellaceae bacterium]
MYKYKFIITSIFLVAFSNVFSQTNIKVLNSVDNQPVAYANVYFPDSKTGTATDKNGVFQVSENAKSVLTQISSVGFQTLLQSIDYQRDTIIFLVPSPHALQEIVVSAFGKKLQSENISNVEQLSLNSVDNQAINLAEKLKRVIGVDNLSTGAGIGKPVIRGLSGNRVAIFSQGVRVENQQWGDEHGLGLDENGYENVEIVKGPASLLYGSDALGGVVYFADERFAKNNTLEAALRSDFQSNTLGTRNTAAFKFSKNKFHFNVFGGYTAHKDYADGAGARVPNSRFNTADVKTNFAYTGENFVTSLKYNYLREKYGLTEIEEEPQIYQNKYRPELPFQDLSTHILSNENTIFLQKNSKIKIDLGYVFNNRKELEDSEVAALNMNLNTFSYNVKWYSTKLGKFSFVAGSQGLYQTNFNRGEEVLIPDAATFDAGAFAMTDFYYAQKAYFQAGVRFDSRNVQTSDNQFDKTYTAFNFSAGIFQPLAKNLSLRANLSSGFRSPNMYELLSDGIHEGTNRYEIGNQDLKIENAYQFDLSVNYAATHLELFANPYFNFIKNFIYVQPSGSQIDDVDVYNYVQGDAFLYGGETGFHLHPHPVDWLHIESAYSTVFGQKTNNDFLPLMPSQKLKTTIKSNFSFQKAEAKSFSILQEFSAYIRYQYSFAQNRLAEFETKTPDYHLVDFGASFDFMFGKQKLLFNISANNIFNEKYFDHLSRYKNEGILNIGRNIIISLSVPFSKNI